MKAEKVEITTDSGIRVELCDKGYLEIYVDGNTIYLEDDEFEEITELVRKARLVIYE